MPFLQGATLRIPQGCLSSQVSEQTVLHAPTIPANSMGTLQEPSGSYILHPGHSMVASTTVVRNTFLSRNIYYHFPVILDLLSQQDGNILYHYLAFFPLNGLADSQPNISTNVSVIILNARRIPTCWSYVFKWKCFSSYTLLRGVTLEPILLSMVLDYFVTLWESGLKFSSLKVHLAAILAFHVSVDGWTLFSHSTTKL